MRRLAGTSARFSGLVALALAAGTAVVACHPSSVSDAEAKGDVSWLADTGSPDAVAALGRLADKNAQALKALNTRESYDSNVYVAAWAATVRGAPWGSALLQAALGDPTQADLAASKMDRHDAHLAPFLAALEQALVRLSASSANMSIARDIAGVDGDEGRAAVTRRLADGATRGAMCRGISAPDSGADAKKALLAAPPSSRDAPACLDAVLKIAATDDDALTWLATLAEPGIVGAAGKSETLPCVDLLKLWARAFDSRPPDAYPALVVPLANAIRRCPLDMDGTLADALTRLPATHPVVINAIDPYDSYGQSLRRTCAALAKVATGASGDAAILRERAEDTREHGCAAR